MESKWISIEERLPEKEGDYLIIFWPDESYTPYTAFYLKELNRWYYAGKKPYVTHWMPLPSPPTEQQD
jgi:ABC-type Fe3+-hydroxamate transport system substrate-binding protein